VLNDLGEIYLLLGSYAEAREVLTRTLAMAQRLGLRRLEVNIQEGLARSLFHLGDLQAAGAHIRKALEQAARDNAQSHRGYYLTTQAYIAEGEGDWGGASQYYLEAVGWWAESDHRSDAVTEPLAGLARVALARGQSRAALRYVEALLPPLARAPLQDVLEPMWVHLTCYQAMAAEGDARATGVLAQAHELLLAQAAQIGDPALRESFLSGVAAHRAIIAASRAAGDTQPPYASLTAARPSVLIA
jgi:ATP/maltotriose-dependent transcriptional regulator MalT